MCFCLRHVRAAVLALIVLSFSAPAAFADCSPGYGLCGDGTCAPLGSVCCGGGRHCDAGTICTNDGHCLPTSSPSFCGGTRYCDSGYVCMKDGRCLSMDDVRYCGGRSYCDAGYVCTKDNKCLAVSDPRYCGKRKYCNPGFACVDNGSTCISQSSPRWCGGGHYCPEGSECTGDGKCRTIGSAAAPAPSGHENDDSSGAVDATQCIGISGNGTTYTIKNSCTYGVSVVLETMDFSPQKTSQDSYYISAGSSIQAISYHGYAAKLIRACGKGQPNCG